MALPVRGRGFDRLVPVEDARRRFLALVPQGPLGSQRVSLLAATGRVLARGVRASEDVPPFDRAAMDGYAVRARDTFGASGTNPLPLKLVPGEGAAGAKAGRIGPGQCRPIATGAPLPAGANAVAMQERTRALQGGLVEFEEALTPYENVARRGEDVRARQVLLTPGMRLSPQDIALAAALGCAQLEVARPPRVAVLSTGDELRDAGKGRSAAAVFDANRPGAMAAVLESGGAPIDLGIVRDRPAAIKSKMAAGLRRADMLVVSGGTSVGARDFAPEAVARLGRPGILVHGVAMRPGYPVALGAVGRKPVVLLPGSPVAAALGVQEFVVPAVRRMLGEAQTAHPRGATVRARVTRRIAGAPGLTTFARVALVERSGKWDAVPLRTSGSGILSSLVRGSGLVIIEAAKEGVEEGEEVDVRLLRPMAAPTARRGRKGG